MLCRLRLNTMAKIERMRHHRLRRRFTFSVLDPLLSACSRNGGLNIALHQLMLFSATHAIPLLPANLTNQRMECLVDEVPQGRRRFVERTAQLGRQRPALLGGHLQCNATQYGDNPSKTQKKNNSMVPCAVRTGPACWRSTPAECPR